MQKIFNKLTMPITMPYWWQDAFLAIPRILCGFWLATEFGAAKFGMPWSPADNNLKLFEVAFWFPNDVAAYGGIFKMFPAFFAWMGAFSEAVGGIFLMLGLQTRLFSFLIVCTMCVAAFLQQWHNGLWAMLASLGFLWLYMFCLVIGSGRYGLDYLISKKIKKTNNEK
ncbi:MAG: DoxX family protein [Chitinophagaceae bacterium]